jgi:tetratricopeptide (TPR) repeat protein
MDAIRHSPDVRHSRTSISADRGRTETPSRDAGEAVADDGLRLGLSCLRIGKRRDAIVHLERAVACAPERHELYTHLGIALAGEGRLVDATTRFREAVRLRPDLASAHNDLGNALRLGREFEGAIACFSTAVALDPSFAEAHLNLGLALAAGKRWSEASAHFARAVALKPDHAGARHLLGVSCAAQDDHANAVAHYEQALRMAPHLTAVYESLERSRRALSPAEHAAPPTPASGPGSPDLHNSLGNALRARGQFEQARACYLEAYRLNPKLPMTCLHLGLAYQEEGRLEEALPWYQAGLRLDPRSAPLQCSLASVLEQQERFDEARECYMHVLKLAPDTPEAHLGLGRIHQEQNRFDEALAAFRDALRLRPDYDNAHFSLGTLLVELGDLEAGEQSLREAIRCFPQHAGARFVLATLLGSKLPNDDLDALRRCATEGNLSLAKQAALHFGLALALDGRGQFEEAAEHLVTANAFAANDRRRRGEWYDAAEHERVAGELIATVNRAFFERLHGAGLDSTRPVFIFGLPRSGTTLTEQLLAGHSQVFSAGELTLARDTVALVCAKYGSNANEPQGLALLDGPETARIARDYLDHLAALDAHAPRLVDKMPENYYNLGLLAVLFPNATFIHCRRDIRDVAVSCWMTNFRQVPWAFEIDHIASRFRVYLELMAHWREVLPATIHEVDYEETVSDPEAVARRLVAWCGLEWEPGCHNIHERRRVVRSASLAQVRQPVSRRSVGRWRHYERALAPLFERLGSSHETAALHAPR